MNTDDFFSNRIIKIQFIVLNLIIILIAEPLELLYLIIGATGVLLAQKMVKPTRNKMRGKKNG